MWQYRCSVHFGGPLGLLFLFLAGAFAVAQLRGGAEMDRTEPYKMLIGGIGMPTLDIWVCPHQKSRGDKISSVVRYAPGGGVRNVLRQARHLGCHVEPIFLIGNDALGRVLKDLLCGEFPTAKFVKGLAATRVSVFFGGRCYTTRPRALIKSLPEGVVKVMRRWSFTVQGAMSGADFLLAADIASRANRLVLTLSAEQLSQRQQSLDLMRKAWLTAMNRDEQSVLAPGVADPFMAAHQLRREGLGNLVVTAPEGAMGFLGDEWLWRRSFQVRKTAATVSAGDVFLGTLLAGKSQGKTWPQAVDLALAASSVLVEGGKNSADLTELGREAQSRKRVDGSPSPRVRSESRRLTYPLFAGGLLCLMALVAFVAT